jgi:TRAP-type C4-dicarboxylate transport system substrate-binding protein
MARLISICLLSVLVLTAHAETLKLATLAPDGSVWYAALRAMTEDWRRISHGEIDVRIYPGGVAGDDSVMVRKMRVGQLNGAALTGDGMASIAAEMRIFQMPMLIRSDAELDHLRDRLAPELEAIALAQGFKILAWSDVGWVYLFSTMPVADPDAARRARMWTATGDTSWLQALKGAGYKPVALPTTEILSGLQSGLIDAFNTPPVAALSSQWFGLAKNMMDLRWSPFVGAIVVTTRFWDRIPPAQRDALQDAARRATAQARTEVRRFEHDAIGAMQTHGLVVHPVSDANARRFEDEIRAVYPQLVGQSIPTSIYTKAKDCLDEYRRPR